MFRGTVSVHRVRQLGECLVVVVDVDSDELSRM